MEKKGISLFVKRLDFEPYRKAFLSEVWAQMKAKNLRSRLVWIPILALMWLSQFGSVIGGVITTFWIGILAILTLAVASRPLGRLARHQGRERVWKWIRIGLWTAVVIICAVALVTGKYSFKLKIGLLVFAVITTILIRMVWPFWGVFVEADAAAAKEATRVFWREISLQKEQQEKQS